MSARSAPIPIHLPDKIRQAIHGTRYESAGSVMMIAAENDNAYFTAIAKKIDIVWYMEFIRIPAIKPRIEHVDDIIKYGTIQDLKMMLAMPKYLPIKIDIEYNPFCDGSSSGIGKAISVNRIDMVEFFMGEKEFYIQDTAREYFSRITLSQKMRTYLRRVRSERHTNDTNDANVDIFLPYPHSHPHPISRE